MSKNIFFQGQVLWSQLDPNMHLRHSAYADFCAQARSNMLQEFGLSLQELNQRKIGPILFREELKYYREIGLNETVRVTAELRRFNVHNSRFSFRHIILKENDVQAAVIEVDGAWIDTVKRKLTTIPGEWVGLIHQLPRSEDYSESKELRK